MANSSINLTQLTKQCTLSPAKCASFVEAASVCLESQNHQPGIELQISGDIKAAFKLFWAKVDPLATFSWQNLEESVEDGAYGIAISTLWELTDYRVIRQSYKGSGFDYWLGEKDEDYPFQEKARLEVSGILKGKTGQINQRLKEKLKQTKKSNILKQPVFVVIVEFSNPIVKIIQR